MSLRTAMLATLLLSLPAAAWAVGATPVVMTISEVQGTGQQSQLGGQRVTVEGIPVYAGDPARTRIGFYLQGLKFDKASKASDSIYVVLPPALAPPKERVRITGTVAELGSAPNTMTALVDVQMKLLGAAKKPFTGFFPFELIERNGIEAYEGHASTFWVTVLSSDHLFDRGELEVSFDGRLFAPTEVATPGQAAKLVAEKNQQRTITLDDSRELDAPASQWYLPWAMSEKAPYRTGTPLFVTGVIVQSGGKYRLIPQSKLSGVNHAARYSEREPAPDVNGNARIASLNVLNLFNGDGKQGAFPTPRGAETYAKYQLQQSKIVASVQALKPDVAALMEIENDGTGPDSALAQFVGALNAAGPINDYRFVDSGKGPGTNPIRVALIYRHTRVATVGDSKTLEGGPFIERSRVPLAQAFRRLVDGKRVGKSFVVVANHFKSKGCGKGETAAKELDADQDDGQGCWNATRVESAKRLDAWVRSDPTGQGADRTLLVGDFNAYAMEDPLTALRSAGWKDALAWGLADTTRKEDDRRRALEAKKISEYNMTSRIPEVYSFVFNGLSGRLDHALLSPALAGRLRGAVEWHNNADEAERFGYDGELGAPGPYRASDHDPLLLGFELD
jgi:uncharacterized protein